MPVFEGEIPWQAAILGPRLCGGTIIGRQWLLTAAHCLMTRRGRIADPENVQVIVGTLEMPKELFYDHRTNYDKFLTVDYFKIHPRVNITTADYDYALVHLANPLNFSSTIRPACLPRSCLEEPMAPQICIISGWGSINQRHRGYQTHLQKALIPLVPRDQCQASFQYDAQTSHVQITSQMICAGNVFFYLII